MNEPLVIWASLLLGVAVVLFFVEVFLPAHGLISLVAGVSLVAGIVLLFKVDTTLGLAGALVAMICVPIFIAMAVKIWPDTPIGRMLTLRGGVEDGIEPSTSMPPGPIVGDKGTALTDLRPVGTCVIHGHRTECLAEMGVIRSGSAVTVVLVDGMHVKVREAISDV